MAAQLQTREVAHDVYRVSSGRVNCYLVREGMALTLIDSGLPKHWGGIVTACTSLGLSLSAIETVLLTHVHTDHAGSTARLHAHNDATVRLHAGDAELTDGRTHRKNERGILPYLWRPTALATLWELAAGGGLRMDAITSYTTVTDGETLDVPGRPTAIHVPGHTQGSVAFVLADRDVCFSGDALVTWNLLTGRRGPQLLASGFMEDSRMAMKSLRASANRSADAW